MRETIGLCQHQKRAHTNALTSEGLRMRLASLVPSPQLQLVGLVQKLHAKRAEKQWVVSSELNPCCRANKQHTLSRPTRQRDLLHYLPGRLFFMMHAGCDVIPPVSRIDHEHQHRIETR